MTAWDDLGARARGLSAHLLDGSRMDRLAAVEGMARLAQSLAPTPYGPDLSDPRPTPAGLEEAFRRRVTRDLGILGRWAGPDRTARLAVVFEEEDARSLRSLLRGAVSGAPADLRIRGTTPTPSLPEERLREAAGVRDPVELAGLLDGWGHPLAPALEPGSGRIRPDLFRTEAELARLWGERAVQGGRKGGSVLRAFVEEAMDAANLRAAVARARSPAGSGEVPFLEGGRWLGSDDFGRALRADGEENAARRLEVALDGSPFQGVTSAGAGRSLDEVLLERRVERASERARLWPVGPGPVLLFLLRLRREVTVLRRILWGLVLEAPPRIRFSGRATRAPGGGEP